MPTYTVLSRKDAFVDYVAEVEAESPAEAARLAHDSDDLPWRERGVVEFDARVVVALDEDGREVDGTAVGDFA